MDFGRHLQLASKAAAESVRAIVQLMPNMGGPGISKRRLLSTVVMSKLLYASPVWAEGALTADKNRRILLAQQTRAALRVIRAYRTVSDEAALVLVEMPPADLIASERGRVSRTLGLTGNTPTKNEIRAAERRRTVEEWSTWWQDTHKAGWTRSVIPDIGRWLGRTSEVQLDYHLTQALTGHGCFQTYLFRMGRAQSPACLLCGCSNDGVEHTLFVCSYWAGDRRAASLGRESSPLNVAGMGSILCGPKKEDLPKDSRERTRLLAAANQEGSAFKALVYTILTKKESLERERQRNGRR